MKRGEPVDRRIPWVRVIHDLDEAFAIRNAPSRIAEVTRVGRRIGDELRAGPKVVSVRTLPNTKTIYPTRFAFNGAIKSRGLGFIEMYNRALFVQLETEEGLKNVLYNPTDGIAAIGTPFYTKTLAKIPDFIVKALSPAADQVCIELRKLGVEPEDIDLIAFDHFHTQDLRPLLGTSTIPARFPNALLLAPEREWDDWGDHPLQRTWFVKDGNRDLPMDRVVHYEADLQLGDGAVLLRTRGHSLGNQTIFVHTDEGVFGCCENGTSADSWNPKASRMKELRKFAEFYDVDVILNANTPEAAGDQYVSMMLERSVVSPAPGNPQFFNMFPSSEVFFSPIEPTVRPTVMFHEKKGGTVVTRREVRSPARPKNGAVTQANV